MQSGRLRRRRSVIQQAGRRGELLGQIPLIPRRNNEIAKQERTGTKKLTLSQLNPMAGWTEGRRALALAGGRATIDGWISRRHNRR